jgi:hypothetical protein
MLVLITGGEPSERVRREVVRQRDARVYSLRLRGWTLREIADEVGFSSISGVHAAIGRARAELVRPVAQHQRDLAGDHLDALTARAWAVVDDPGPRCRQGRWRWTGQAGRSGIGGCCWKR